jgi:hypothetical protein
MERYHRRRKSAREKPFFPKCGQLTREFSDWISDHQIQHSNLCRKDRSLLMIASYTNEEFLEHLRNYSSNFREYDIHFRYQEQFPIMAAGKMSHFVLMMRSMSDL